MRITRIFARHFLSFGDSFEFTFQSQKGTVLVGPNGHGKSNVLRLLKTLLDVLESRYLNLEEPALYASRYADFGKEIRSYEIGFDFALHSATERDLLQKFIRDLISFPNYEVFRRICVDSNEKNVEPIPERRIAVQNFLLNYLEIPEDFCLDNGTLRYRVEPSDPHNSRLDIEFPDMGLIIPLRDGILIPKVNNGSYSGKPLSQVYFESLPEKTFKQLQSFLAGETSTMPTFSKLNMKLISKTIRDNSLNVDLELNRREQQKETSYIRLSLLQALKVALHGSEIVKLSDLYRKLISESIFIMDSWHQNTEVILRPCTPDVSLIQNRELPLYLFLMKNGTFSERTKYDTIRSQFRNLTGAEMDVIVKHRTRILRQNETVEEQYITLTTNEDIPMSFSGSGREQVITLLTLAQLDQHIIGIDEPERNLHPWFQSRIGIEWIDSLTQHLVITHSPFIAASFGIEQIRRVYMSNKWSAVTNSIDSHQISKSGLKRLTQSSDDFLFLFAKCVILVEGYGEIFGLPIWLNQWTNREFGLSAEALGIHIQNATGKSRITSFISLYKQFHIPWVALYDADILRKFNNKGEELSENKKIFRELASMGLMQEDEITLGEKSEIDKFPIGTDNNIFLRGNKLSDKWETLKVDPDLKQEARDTVGKGPQMWQYIADHMKVPKEFETLFARARELGNVTQ
ncbi:TOPRIM nucleotidyl transferase/hydrolase domain-containing protein [Alicyclobacillus sp. SO9]|uniref:AAA family ATPase n=1 Tax=Alicyclobacillus sp. SO9 TaxID=2665646 RepID=UPI0018E77D96|nr:TOPRIM nucleotidyl transferase/hydrolase domain-containing protein [Alicyclobacillus sp. SO9]QQE77282.1 AAA family ATPase [Alicyclobacillus sp. SO9]